MLCSRENETFAMATLEQIGFGHIMGIVGKNVMGGTFGKCFEHLFIKRSLRKCRLIGSIFIGEKLPNSTYTGTLGMIQSKKVDMYLRGETEFLNEEWLGRSVPIGMENVLVFHPIQEQKAISIFNLLDNFKIGFTLSATFLLSFLGILALSFLINELTHRIHFGETTVRRPKLLKRIASAWNSFGVNRLSAIGIFVLFVHQFIWVTELFLTNNIKTNKVVVDTSKLIKDEHDVLSSPLVPCFFDNDQLSNLIARSPTNNSILSRIFYEKTRVRPDVPEQRAILGKDRCLLGRNPREAKLLDHGGYLFAETKIRNTLLSMPIMVDLLPKKMWLNEMKFFGYKLIVYYNRDKPRLALDVLRYTENGVISKTYDCSDKLGRENCRAAKKEVFESLEAYIEEYSGFSDLVLDNFLFIFLYYFLFCSLVFVAFLVHHLVKYVKKNAIQILILIRSQLENYKNRILFWKIGRVTD